MKIIHKYVLREHAGPLVFSLSALTSLLLLNYIAKQFGNLVGKGLSWTVIAEFFGLSVPFTLAMTLPMAVLVSTLYAFSRLAAENEITALKASGVSLARLTIPVLMAAGVLSILMVLFNDQVLPRANHRLRTLQGDIARKKPTFALREQVINEVSPGRLFLRAGHLDEFTNRMREVTIYDMGDPLRRRTIYADSGFMAFAPNQKDLVLTLFHGHMLEISKANPLQLQRLYYENDYVRAPDVANGWDPTKDDSYKSDREMSVCELQNEVARSETDLDRAMRDLRQAMVGAVHEAATGQPANLPQDISLAAPSVPGAPAARSRHVSLGRTYCDVSTGLRKLSLQKVGKAVKTALWPRVAYAAQGQDTTRAKKDTTKAVKDSTQARTDTARQVPSAVSGDRPPLAPNPKIDPSTIQPNVNPQVPVPAPVTPAPGQATPGVPPSAGGGVPVLSGAVPGDTSLHQVPTTVAPSYTGGLPQPYVATAAIEGARSRLAEARRQVNQNAVELHKKFAISIACIVFVLVGAPIALRFPRGGVGLVIGVSMVVFAIYYVGLIAGETLADNGYVPPAVSMWAANVLLSIVGLVLFARIGREGATSRGGDLSELLDTFKQFLRTLTFRRHTEVA